MPNYSTCRQWAINNEYRHWQVPVKKGVTFIQQNVFLWQLKEQPTAAHPAKNYMRYGMKKEDLLIFKPTKEHIVPILGNEIPKTITGNR